MLLKKLFFMVILSSPSFIITASELDYLDESALDFSIEELGNRDEEIASDPWRMIFSWQNGVDINALDSVRSHRFDARLDWEQLLFNDYFFKIDGKAIIRLPGDDNLGNERKTELDGRLKTLFLQKSGDLWSFTAGFQTLILGEMDTLQVTDFLSPWDYSEFAFTSPEDARLGQLLLNGEWYSEQNFWQILYSPWPLSNRYPGGDGRVLIQQLLGNESITVNDNQPELFKDHEIVLKWKKSFPGSDLTFVYANLLNNDPLFTLINTENKATKQFETEYFRFNLFSASLNYSAGNILWKMESAYKQGMKYQAPSILESNAWDIAIGADYDANGAWSMSLEILNQHLLESEKKLLTLNKNNTQIVARWSKNWLNETLRSVIFFSYQLQYKDIITSLSFDYALDDDWQIALVATVFESTDTQSPGQLTKDWDQVSLRISFAY